MSSQKDYEDFLREERARIDSELHADDRRTRIFAPQVERFLDVWSDHYLLDDISTTLSCSEADALADLLRFFDYDESADVLIEAHATGDDEGDRHWEGMTTT